ncbi:hypothetical protein [Pedobacter gandavensis]|uniref:hypothetical protein n=1 Tax=Pedobacter gandavensis TaxID=2679963 RepID=UPI00292FAC6F|nr:hypothetical protein [Pedobacter gandavensis]
MNALKPIHYISFIISLLLGFFLIKGYPNYGELTVFPFSANVWGTFSDIAILLVTSATLYFLFRNLQAQSETLDIQRQALIEQKGEKDIYKLQIRPDIEVSEMKQISDKPSVSGGPLIDRKFQLTLEIIDAGMRSCKPLEFSATDIFITPQLQYDKAKNYSIGHKIIITLEFQNVDPRPQSFYSPKELILDFHFTDTLGNAYSKKINLNSNGINHLEPPIAIPAN